MIAHLPRIVVAAIAIPMLSLTACNFSFSSGGGLDYEKLQTTISDDMKSTYSDIVTEPPSVTCDEPKDPKPGDKFVCTGDVSGQPLRVEVTLKDDQGNVDYQEMDLLYDLPRTAQALDTEIETQMGFPVTVDCGEGLKSVEKGGTFDCQAIDENGVAKTVKVTATQFGKVKWEIVD